MSCLNELRKKVRQRLEAEGLSQQWLAERIGTSQPYISDFLTGKLCPTFDRCEKIANLLGIEIEVREMWASRL